MNRAGQLLLGILWPNVCDCCGRDTAIAYDRLICERCEEKLNALRADDTDRNGNAPDSAEPWAGSVTAFRYEAEAKAGVLAAKDGARGFSRYAAGILAGKAKEFCKETPISFVTWVPMTRRRQQMQGFAHAELLAKYCAEALHVPARGGYLQENAGKLRQHALSASERALYAQRFHGTGKRLAGETVLLCDDILTTGSTLRRCTELLLEAGAGKVYIAAACCTVYQQAKTDQI